MIYDTKTKEWCSLEKTVVFDSVGYKLTPENGMPYLLTENEFECRCVYQKNIKSKKRALKQEINNTIYGIIKYLYRKDKDYGQLTRSIDLLKRLENQYNALPKA